MGGLTSWQDLAFASGGVFFALALLPMLRNPETVVPRATSSITAAFLWVFVAAHFSLGLYLAACAETCSAAAWSWLAWRRAPRQRRM